MLAIEMLPVAVVAVVGEKVALKVVFWPPVKVRGSVGPLMLKLAPVTVA